MIDPLTIYAANWSWSAMEWARPEISGRLLPAAILTLLFAGGARLLRGASRSGAVAGAAVSFLLYASVGYGGFVALVLVFALAFLSTRTGFSRKQQLGTAEKREGRSAAQVFANLGVGTAAAVLSVVFHEKQSLLLLAATAALAEAAADTVSSEFGQAASNHARLITTWKSVPAGTNGGVTLKGSIAGLVAAAVVGASCGATSLISWRWVPVASGAAFAGMLFDSLLGATFERNRRLNNDQVNFLGTLSASFLALIFASTLV